MYRLALRQATVCSALLYFALALPAAGQGRGKVKQKQPTDLSSVGGADSLNNLKFRNLGPSVAGGRVAAVVGVPGDRNVRSEEHTSELQSRGHLVCRLLLEKKKTTSHPQPPRYPAKMTDPTSASQ